MTRCCAALALLVAMSSCGSSAVAPTPVARQIVYYVGPNGSDRNSGSLTAPLRTMRAAVARLQAGDTLYLREGVYTGPDNTVDSQAGVVPSGSSWKSPIVIGAYQGEAVTLQPPHNVAGIRLTGGQSYLVFQDLTIDMGNSRPGADADGVFVFRAHHNRFLRLEVKNSVNFGVHFGTETPFNEVIECRIHENGVAGGAATNGHGLYISGSDNLFENNDVYDNQGYGFHVYNNAGPHTDPSRNVVRDNRIYRNGRHQGTAYGVTVAWGNANEIVNNSIYGNPGGIQVYTDSSNTVVQRNSIYDNRPLEGIIVQNARGARLSNNIIYSNGTDIVDLGIDTRIFDNALRSIGTAGSAPR